MAALWFSLMPFLAKSETQISFNTVCRAVWTPGYLNQWRIPFLTEYEYQILFGFQKSLNTEYQTLFGIEKIRIPNTKYYSLSIKSEYRIQILLFGLTIQKPNTKYWIVNKTLEKIKLKLRYLSHTRLLFWKYVKLFVKVFGSTIWIPEYYLECQKKTEYWILNTIRYWENLNTEYENYYLVQHFE